MAPLLVVIFLNPKFPVGDVLSYRGRLVIYDRETMVKVGDQLCGVDVYMCP